MVPKDFRDKLNVLLSQDTMENKDYKRLKKVVKRLRLSADALPTTQTGQWTSFSILKAPEEQETQDSTAQARFSELSQRKTRQLEAVDKNQKQLKELFETSLYDYSPDQVLRDEKSFEKYELNRQRIKTYLSNRGPPRKRQEIFEYASIWFEQHIRKQQAYRRKLIAVETALDPEHQMLVDPDGNTMKYAEQYHHELDAKKKVLSGAIGRLKECHMELKKNVSSPHDVYQELNDQVEKNSTLNRRCEISQAEKEDLLGRLLLQEEFSAERHMHLEKALAGMRLELERALLAKNKLIKQDLMNFYKISRLRTHVDRAHMVAEDHLSRLHRINMAHVPSIEDDVASFTLFSQIERESLNGKYRDAELENYHLLLKNGELHAEIVTLKGALEKQSHEHRVASTRTIKQETKGINTDPQPTPVAVVEREESKALSLLEQEFRCLQRYNVKLEKRIEFLSNKINLKPREVESPRIDPRERKLQRRKSSSKRRVKTTAEVIRKTSAAISVPITTAPPAFDLNQVVEEPEKNNRDTSPTLKEKQHFGFMGYLMDQVDQLKFQIGLLSERLAAAAELKRKDRSQRITAVREYPREIEIRPIPPVKRPVMEKPARILASPQSVTTIGASLAAQPQPSPRTRAVRKIYARPESAPGYRRATFVPLLPTSTHPSS